MSERKGVGHRGWEGAGSLERGNFNQYIIFKKSTYSKKEVAHFLGALLKVTLSGSVGAEC